MSDSSPSPVAPHDPTKLATLRQTTEERVVLQMKSSGTITRLTPDDTIKKLRWPGDAPTKYERRFRELFLQAFPEAASNVETYQTKPTCGCRKPLLTLVSLKYEQVNTILEQVYGARIYEVQNIVARDVTPTIANPSKAALPTLAGRSALIEPTPEAYNQYFVALRNMPVRQYNGVSVVPTVDTNNSPKWALLFW